MTTRLDLEGFVVGAFVRRALAWQDDGDVVPLTDRTFQSQIRYTPGDPVAFDWVVAVDEEAGIIELELPVEVSELLPAGLLWWDLYETTPGSEDVVLRGRIPVARRVTIPVGP